MPDAAPPPQPLFADRYRLRRVLGQGGMGIVYLAFDVECKREVALKTILPVQVGEDIAPRFRREYQALAAIDHRGVPKLLDAGAAGGVHYFTMEIVRGTSLRELLERGPLPPLRALGIAVELAEILAAAHAHGVVHRDVKPNNLIVEGGDRVRLLDFGACCPLTAFHERPCLAGEPTTTHRFVTNDAHAIGTFGYSAPECLAPKYSPDVRSDVYSVCVILYEMAFGARFPGVYQLLTADFPGALEPLLSELRMGTSVEIDCRHDDMLELAASLRRARVAVAKAMASPARPAAAPSPVAPPPDARSSRGLWLSHVALWAVWLTVVGSPRMCAPIDATDPELPPTPASDAVAARPSEVLPSPPVDAPVRPPDAPQTATRPFLAAIDAVWPDVAACARGKTAVVEVTAPPQATSPASVKVETDDEDVRACVKHLLGPLVFMPTATRVHLLRTL